MQQTIQGADFERDGGKEGPKERREALWPAAARVFAMLVLIALLTTLGCSAPAKSPEDSAEDSPRAEPERILAPNEARPPFVRIDGGPGATLFVMGTIHLGPKQGWQFPEAIERAIREADDVVMEVDLKAMTDDEVATLLGQLVVLPPGTTIDQVVEPETERLLAENDALLTHLGLPENARKRYDPWFLAMSLLEVALRETEYDMGQSAEKAILSRIGERPVIGLERLEDQLRMLDGLTPSLQDAMLRDTVGRLPESVAEVEALITAWRIADRPALEEISRQGLDELPELEGFYDILLTQRNRRWTRTLRGVLDDPARSGETLFVAVGALHMVGPLGVPQMLADEGYRISRIH